MPSSPEHLHRFAQPRPSKTNIDSQAGPTFAGSPFQDLPPPTEPYPYRLNLADIVPDAVAAMTAANGMVLHMAGDTGGIRDANPQQLVANGLEHDAGVAGDFGRPAFFYHLGDVVYFTGQASEYLPQFYKPYEHYPNPILAIPGNHDGDVARRGNPEPSLVPFVRNFCQATAGVHSPDAEEEERTAMIQPNVYWTLLTPFATFVGLYTNVPEGGVVKQDQQDWFADELKNADTGKPLIVAMHHPVHSLDEYHSGSEDMAKVLDHAVTKSNRRPEIVFNAHVHNYQRFTVDIGNDQVLPFVVAGNGGYHNLTPMIKVDNQDIVTPYRDPSDATVMLESYIDDRFAFLRVEISADIIDVRCYTVPRPQEAWGTPPRLYDRMRLDWRKRKILL